MIVVHQISEKVQTATDVRPGPVDIPETFFNKSASGEVLMRRHKQAVLVGELLDIKRVKSVREHDLSFLFFGIGLLLSMAIVVIAFEWRIQDNSDQIELTGSMGDEFEDLIEIPPTVQPPPPPLQNQQVIITEVSDQIELEEFVLDLDVEATEEMRVSDVIIPDLLEELPEEKVEEVFLIVESMPTPKEGLQEFYKYLSENIRYPSNAKRLDISGRVYIQFIVGSDGAISNIEVVKGIGGGCDEEAVRVLQDSPSWNPGKQRGKPVKVRMTIPVYFTLIN